MPTKKKPGAAPKKAAAKKPTEREQLLAQLAKTAGVAPEEAELQLLREAVARQTPSAAPPAKGSPSAAAPRAQEMRAGNLPRRLYLLLDGRGLDGRGLPIEVIDNPTLVGSGKMCGIWVNSPQIETRHLSIGLEGDDWVLTDLQSEKGTLFAERPVERRVLQHGDEFALAGYLRLRAEFR